MSTAADHRPEDTGTRRRLVDLGEPALPPRVVVVECAGCKGRGKVQMSVHNVLGESLALIADDADAVVGQFYERLFTLAPAIATLFPADILSATAHAQGSRGARQRDQLVGALVKLATLYGAGELEEAELDGILRQAGRSHAAFTFAGETVPRPAGPAEYALVKRALFDTLTEVAGDRWRPEYTEAWSAAYDYAETEMRHAAQHEGRAMQMPRTTRRAAEH